MILVGGIDLSVGSLLALCTVTGSLAFQHIGIAGLITAGRVGAGYPTAGNLQELASISGRSWERSSSR